MNLYITLYAYKTIIFIFYYYIIFVWQVTLDKHICLVQLCP